MTWLSRLLPQTPSLQRRVSTHHNRTAKQRRRVMTLESLEQRVVLSNVSASFAAGVLTINTDSFNNQFKITETTAASPNFGKVTVSSLAPYTTINSTAADYQTPSAVTAINVKVNGSFRTSDVIQLVGAGKTAATTVKTVNINVGWAALNLSVDGVNNSGAFSLTTMGKLDASISNSAFSSLSIDQSNGCCQATVDLNNDLIPGAVSIKEGKYSNDSVSIEDSVLGSTLVAQGNGSGDSVSVSTSSVRDLTVNQGDGSGDSISIDGLKVASNSFGVLTNQGNGNGDSTTITGVTVAVPVFNRPILVPSIYVNQGNGSGDSASVSSSNVPGNIVITQGDGAGDSASIADSFAGLIYRGLPMFGVMAINQGNGNNDSASVDNVVANAIYVNQGDGNEDSASITNSTSNGDVAINQGNGGPNPDDFVGDTATIDNVTAFGGIWVVQGNGDYDSASITNSTAGDDISITQGDGFNDQAIIDSVSTSGAIEIVQGSGDYDYASITNADPTDISITQGDGYADQAVIDTVVADGNIWISQGNGDYDVASISNATSNYGAIWIDQGGGYSAYASISNVFAWDDVSITQGDGTLDSASIDGAQAWNIWIEQGNGVLDYASVTNSTAYGDAVPVFDNAGNLIYWIDDGGNISITQGDGYGDYALVDTVSANNIYVTQGNNLLPADPSVCYGYPGDGVDINNALVTSDIQVTQGTEGSTDGYYYTGIGTAGPVTAGGWTSITQAGGANQVFLGGDGSTFDTNYLDVFTGLGGGGFVQATNTTVYHGSFWGFDFTVDGGGDGNTLYLAGGDFGVVGSSNYNVV